MNRTTAPDLIDLIWSDVEVALRTQDFFRLITLARRCGDPDDCRDALAEARSELYNQDPNETLWYILETGSFTDVLDETALDEFLAACQAIHDTVRDAVRQQRQATLDRLTEDEEEELTATLGRRLHAEILTRVIQALGQASPAAP